MATLSVNISGVKLDKIIKKWYWKLRRLPYIIPKFHELCSTNS